MSKIDDVALKAYRRAWCEWANITPVERLLSRDEYALEAYEAAKAEGLAMDKGFL